VLTKFITTRVDKELAERLERLAAEHERSLSGQIRLALREHLARESENRTRTAELQEVA
jgi:predicted transcriptional regulator